ncbi:MAG TPA: quinoprotein dehydrogenase-associated putative ABC transporter substrate-binding protein [Methyloprofundus sp.]|uniref:quinoprotein dehydrogenase-associated putative ABC transporter substrate-binding protein n=1 Tax=Methyloprofundus sp. TaxID=2020875 RepID=UPI001844C941|nr:quinoprotein dehydrogenase-associated putative ABC transporter substrate-binding protein [Methyloprofundus sp.]HIG64311.1 quinoprotein dehydrogenase-associated putative ABC transporter substrate-binding protein [Methyloprofundus sp.]HIL78798.1 quinoprotein dehydrogenase-associated putative ABC transporter substrate-binding protein [Methylococcales bacterium]
MSVLHQSKSLLAALLFSTLTFSSYATEKFRVCADPLNPPYSTKKQDGYENKIAELFAQQLGQEAEYYWFPQRIGFVRNTLKATIGDTDQYKCDVIIGVPAGFDFTATTNSYYHSTYVLLIAKGRGWDNITIPEQLRSLPLAKQDSLKIAMFDRGPGTAWLQQSGLLEQGVPYQTMTGDDKNNTAMMIEKELQASNIDMVILWGPMAGYIVSQNPNDYFILPMKSTRAMKFDYSMAMGVRYGDKARKAQLNDLISKNQQAINKILESYLVPLLPTPTEKPHKDDD